MVQEDHLRGGCRAGLTLPLLDGGELRLSSLCGKPVVIEFGSIPDQPAGRSFRPWTSSPGSTQTGPTSCPSTRGRPIRSGTPSFPHRSFEEKVECARMLRELDGSPRTFLVDVLDGDLHRAYGGLPNMSWVIDRTGRVLFKAGWTKAEDVREALDSTLRIRELKSEEGQQMPTYYKESIGDRVQGARVFTNQRVSSQAREAPVRL